MSAGLATTLFACGAPVPLALHKAQSYVHTANLVQLDLPSGWSVHATPSGNGASPVVSLSGSQQKIVNGIVSSLPTACQVLKATFVASLKTAPPPGSVAQDVAQFSSAADGNATISSTVVAFGTGMQAEATFALYAAATFPDCLQAFLRLTLPAMFHETLHLETIRAVPVPTLPVGINGVAFSVETQAAPGKNSQTQVSVSEEVVIQSGRALAFVEEQSQTTALPADTQIVFHQSVLVVAHRLAAGGTAT